MPEGWNSNDRQMNPREVNAMNQKIVSPLVVFAALLAALTVCTAGADGALSDATYQAYGLNFSPYIANDEDPNLGGSQITSAELEQRMDLVVPYTQWIRTFACNADLEEAGAYAHTKGLKAAIGAWLGSNRTEDDSQIHCLIDQAREGNVDIAIVGSEVLLRGDLSEADLIGYINEVKDSLVAAGIDVPVTYADVWGVLISHPNVLAAVDLIFVNYYPYWEGRKVDYAIAYVHRQHQQMVAAAGGKEVIVSETGWPSCGNEIGEAVPSPENASFYFLNFVSWARANDVKYFYFETYDEGWKASYEGPQGACWGIWNKESVLKPGMQQVFDGETMADNWSRPVPDAPIIDFAALPALVETNIPAFVVAGYSEPGDSVFLNGALLLPEQIDSQGNFAATVPLVAGDNFLELVIKSGEDTLAAAMKAVRFNQSFNTCAKRLLYVNSVPIVGVPSLPGTIVIDLDNASVLGLIPDKYVVGISPNASEIYTSDRTVISTATCQELRMLAFSQEISTNSFLVSPGGTRLYSRNERLDVASNTVLGDKLPIDITTGSSWCSAPIPGGAAISSDGKFIYCGNNVRMINTEDNTVENVGISGLYMSDIGLSPNDSMLLVSEYSYESGRLDIYDAYTRQLLTTVYGLGDFSGEIAFSKDKKRAVVGSAGNPQNGGGRLTAVDLATLGTISQTLVPLADNVATSGNDEFFASSGESGLFRRLGIDVFVLDPGGTLVRTKTFFLGINRFIVASCLPQNDQIRKIVFKPARSQTSVNFSLLSATGENGYVFLSWQMAVDVPLSSFSLRRAESADEAPARVNADISRGLNRPFCCVDHSVTPGKTYWYWIAFAGSSGEESFGPFEVHVDAAPTAYAVCQSYPNPFNPLCTIRYATPTASRVSLRVFNVDGSLVRTLVDRWREAGVYSVEWDGKADDGRAQPSGIYFYRLKAADFVATRKMVLLQ